MRCPVSGCSGSPTVLASGAAAYALAVDTTSVYWSEASNVYRCDLTGCGSGPTLLWTAGAGYVTALASDGNEVFATVSNGGGGHVEKCAVAGCGGTGSVLVQLQSNILGLAVAGGAVYWTTKNGTPGTVNACAKSGCAGTPQLFWTGSGQVEAIASNGSNVYWSFVFASGLQATLDEILTCPTSGCGAQPAIVATNQFAQGIVVDNKDVVWISDRTTLKSCSLPSCGASPATQLATVPPDTFGFVQRPLALDSDAIYWTTLTDGAVYRLAR